MKKWPFLSILTSMAALPGTVSAQGRGFILLASTIAPIDSDIVPLLEEQFETETGIRVRHVGAGTGEALKIAQKGQIDLVIVHAQALEEKFIRDGFGTQRIPLMYNDFVIVGPAGAWYKIYEKSAEGNAPTLIYTDEIGAYTVIDRATYLSMKKRIKLAILVEGDEALLNYVSLIPVNPQKFPTVNVEDTKAFVQWLTSPAKGQRIIRDFGKDKYGSPLFFPNSEAWRKQNN